MKLYDVEAEVSDRHGSKTLEMWITAHQELNEDTIKEVRHKVWSKLDNRYERTVVIKRATPIEKV